MSVALYRSVDNVLKRHVSAEVPESSRDRLSVLVLGVLGSQSSAPAQMAEAIAASDLSPAKPASIERRIRRAENDAHLTVEGCFDPLARRWLAENPPEEVILIVDPTTQDDRVVKVTVSIWYRGRSLPLAWTVYPANQPLEAPGFWVRIEALLAHAQGLLPSGCRVICVADRAFGTPQFTDLVAARDWYYVVRVQGQTRWQDRQGVTRRVDALVSHKGQRAHAQGLVFKGRGWRPARVVVYWRRRLDSPLCLVSNLPNTLALHHILQYYRQRFAIEATFRDEKSSGWHWENNQVKDLDHTRRLLIAMALSIWFATAVGTQVAAERLDRPVTPRRSRPFYAKFSLFTLGKHRLKQWHAGKSGSCLRWRLDHWSAPNWSYHAWRDHRYLFVFA